VIKNNYILLNKGSIMSVISLNRYDRLVIKALQEEIKSRCKFDQSVEVSERCMGIINRIYILAADSERLGGLRLSNLIIQEFNAENVFVKLEPNAENGKCKLMRLIIDRKACS